MNLSLLLSVERSPVWSKRWINGSEEVLWKCCCNQSVTHEEPSSTGNLLHLVAFVTITVHVCYHCFQTGQLVLSLCGFIFLYTLVRTWRVCKSMLRKIISVSYEYFLMSLVQLFLVQTCVESIADVWCCFVSLPSPFRALQYFLFGWLWTIRVSENIGS
jgi:hypothetical protein